MSDYEIVSYDFKDFSINPRPEDCITPRKFAFGSGLDGNGNCNGTWIDCSLKSFDLPWRGDGKLLVTQHRHDGCTIYTVEACSRLVLAAEQVAVTEGGEWEVSPIVRETQYPHPTHPSYMRERLSIFMRRKLN